MARGTVYNGDLVTEEKLAQVNVENVDLLEEFIEYLHSTDKATLTIVNYTSDINIAFCWNLENNKNKIFTDWTKRDVMKFQNFMLTEMQLSPGRVRRLRSALSSMSNFIENILDDDFPNFRNIINKIPAPTNSHVREKTVFSEEQLKELLDACITKEDYQKACLIALAMYSGARKAELLRFKVDYFDKKNLILNGNLYQTPEKITSKGRGKQGKMIYKYCLADEFQPYLDLWMKQRSELGIDSEWLFVTDKDGGWSQMSTSTADSWARTFSNMAGTDFYWHSLRHYFTTYLSQKKKLPDKVIQTLNSWASIGMVQIYSDVSAEDELGEYFK